MPKHTKAEIIESIYTVKLSPELFDRFTQFIQQRCGIRITPSKKNMLEGRLRKRMRALLLPTFEDYARCLFHRKKSAPDETAFFLDAITTNKTEFFREAAHFDYLCDTILPKFIKREDRHRTHTFRIWSAGCSSGEEPYSLAMILNEFAEKNPLFSYAILATDLSNRELVTAKAGEYNKSQLDDIETEYRSKYFTTARTEGSDRRQVIAALRRSITFKHVNLMAPAFPIRKPLQAVFCRNVMMYFDRSARTQLVSRLAEKIEPGGYLFTGHSESLAGLNTNLQLVANAVYQKPRA